VQNKTGTITVSTTVSADYNSNNDSQFPCPLSREGRSSTPRGQYFRPFSWSQNRAWTRTPTCLSQTDL